MRLFFIILASCLLPANGISAAESGVDYLRDVKPILAKHCYECHGPLKQRSGLRLDTAPAIRQGGDSGAAILPGKSGESRLIKAVLGLERVKQMPPKEPRLTAAQIAVLRRWIDQGARAPSQEVAERLPPSKHWAFQP